MTHRKIERHKSISIIGSAGVPAKYGGFETLAEYLIRNLGDSYDLNVYCSSRIYLNKPKFFLNARLHYINLSANGKSSVLYDILSILKSCRNSNVLLVLGVSGAIILPLIKMFTKKKIIVNIDGIEWKRQKWSNFAQYYLKIQERIAIKFSHYIISDNLGIQEYVLNNYNVKSVLISYGADHAQRAIRNPEIDMSLGIQEEYAFTVCRIEPENNVHLILEAFLPTDLQLVIVGNWSDSEYGLRLIDKYQNSSRIRLINPIYDQRRLNSLRSNCKVYIHGHSAGGTNPSLVEAMFLGLPIFCWKVNYNLYTTHKKCKYFSSVKELSELIRNTSEVELAEIGIKMGNIAKKHYLWSNIAKKYAALF